MAQVSPNFSERGVDRLDKIENDIGALFDLLKEINDKSSEQLKSDRNDHEIIRSEIRGRNNKEKAELETNLEKAAKKSKLYLGIIVTVVTLFCAFLGWYAKRAVDEYKFEQKQAEVDKSIQKNTQKISGLESMTIDLIFMTEKGFDRIDELMVKATGMSEEELPPKPPEIKKAVEEAKTLKIKKHVEESSEDSLAQNDKIN